MGLINALHRTTTHHDITITTAHNTTDDDFVVDHTTRTIYTAPHLHLVDWAAAVHAALDNLAPAAVPRPHGALAVAPAPAVDELAARRLRPV